MYSCCGNGRYIGQRAQHILHFLSLEVSAKVQLCETSRSRARGVAAKSSHFVVSWVTEPCFAMSSSPTPQPSATSSLNFGERMRNSLIVVLHPYSRHVAASWCILPKRAQANSAFVVNSSDFLSGCLKSELQTDSRKQTSSRERDRKKSYAKADKDSKRPSIPEESANTAMVNTHLSRSICAQNGHMLLAPARQEFIKGSSLERGHKRSSFGCCNLVRGLARPEAGHNDPANVRQNDPTFDQSNTWSAHSEPGTSQMVDLSFWCALLPTSLQQISQIRALWARWVGHFRIMLQYTFVRCNSWFYIKVNLKFNVKV